MIIPIGLLYVQEVSSLPILCDHLLYKMRKDFLDIQYFPSDAIPSNTKSSSNMFPKVDQVGPMSTWSCPPHFIIFSLFLCKKTIVFVTLGEPRKMRRKTRPVRPIAHGILLPGDRVVHCSAGVGRPHGGVGARPVHGPSDGTYHRYLSWAEMVRIRPARETESFGIISGELSRSASGFG